MAGAFVKSRKCFFVADLVALAAVACSDGPPMANTPDAGSGGSDMAMIGSGGGEPDDAEPDDGAANAMDDALGWTGGQGDAAWLQCGEFAPLDVPTFADATAAPGMSFRMTVRVKVNPRAAVPLWLWQPARILPEPMMKLDPTALDQGWTTVSFPLETPGSYHVQVHTHYPGTDACAAELYFEAK